MNSSIPALAVGSQLESHEIGEKVHGEAGDMLVGEDSSFKPSRRRWK